VNLLRHVEMISQIYIGFFFIKIVSKFFYKDSFIRMLMVILVIPEICQLIS